MTRARWHTVAYDGPRRIVWIADRNDGGRSVTNDAEHVVAEVAALFPGCRIIYRDTMNNWDELKHADGKFAGFAPAPGLAPRLDEKD